MAGQLLLSAAGTYSTTRPTITLFNTVQHEADTELRETFEIPFDNSKTFFGSRSTCTISKRSDILTGVTLRAILPPIYPVQSDQYVYPTPSSQVGGTVYADMKLTQVVADGVTLTATTNGNHYFSVGAQVTLAGTRYLIFNLDGTYTIASIPTANSFTCSTILAGVSYNGTASVPGIVPSDVVGYFSTANSNLWVNNLTNKTWQITAGSNVGTSWTFTTSAPSDFPVGSSVVLNLANSGVVSQTFTVTASTGTTFTCTIDDRFVIVGNYNQAYSTNDGLSWTSVLVPLVPEYCEGVAFGNGVYVAVVDSGNGTRYTAYSTDNGFSWTPVVFVPSSPNYAWKNVSFGNGVFVTVGGNIQGYSTDNGLTWTNVASPLSGFWYGVAFGNGVFVMVGAFNKQARSIDNGLTWTNVASPLSGFWTGLAFGNGVFVMTGQNCQAYSTNNGVSWTSVASPLSGSWQMWGLTYGNGVFVMVGLSGKQARSIDNGVSWTLVANPIPGEWRGVSFGNGVFVMVGVNAQAYSTDNGLTWNLLSTNLPGIWFATTFGSFSYVISSSDSVSLVTPPLQLTNRVFSSSVYPSISFANATDAAFWGFDVRQGLTYTLQATPPWTLTQSGWISGFLPPSQSSWTDSVANKLCKSVRVMCGKQTIQEYTGEYLELKNDLTIPYENKAILKLLNGTLDQTQATVLREYYVSLPFGTKEIPLCALTRQQMSIDIDFEEYANLSQNLNQGTGSFLDTKSYTTYNASTGILGGQPINVQTTFSYQQYIFIVAYGGQFIVYDTTKSITDPTSYITLSAFSGTNLFKQFCVLSGNLYIGLTNGQLARMIITELIQGNISSFVVNNYTPTSGSLTGTVVADFRYVYYALSNTASSNVFMTRYDTTSVFTSPSSYTTVDFTKTFNSDVNGVYQILSTGTELIMLPQGTLGSLYTYQLNANVQSQWYSLGYSSYGFQITEGVVIGGGAIYFVIDNYSIIRYSNSIFSLYNYFGPTFVTVGEDKQAYSTNNGKSRTSVASPLVGYWQSVTFGNGVFVMVGYDCQAYSTDNGRSWTLVASPLVGYWESVTFGKGTFVMVGLNCQAYSTDKGLTWTYIDNSGTWTSVTFGDNRFVMVGTDVQANSLNGQYWAVSPVSLPGPWRSVAYGNGTFVMVGSILGPAYSNTGGFDWYYSSPSALFNAIAVSFGNGVFVTSGQNEQGYSNDNGLSWSLVVSPLSENWESIMFGNGIFFMTAYPSNLGYSTDGISWSRIVESEYWTGVAASLPSISGNGFRNLIAVGNYIYCSTSTIAVQIDTSQDLLTAAAYKYPAPLPVGNYVFANGPRYVYMFAQGNNTATNIVRYDPYPPTPTLQASILVDYKSSKTKPTTASLRIVQSQKVTTMDNLDIRCPVKELWLMGATNGYQYSNLASQCSLLINNEPLLTLDVGTQKYLKTIEPFETHTSMPIRNFSVLSFEFNPESPKPNGTINFSRIHEQQFTGGATHAWASTYNIFVIKDGVGGLMFNF
jgi:hypothetical protein